MYEVLIVDDDAAIRYLLKRYKKWEIYNFQIKEEARHGKEALEKLKEFSFDLIITDIKMPGMDGLTLLHELKNKQFQGAVILLSTHQEFLYAQEGMRLGALDYVVKPVDDMTLDTALERAKIYLDEKSRQWEKEKSLYDPHHGVKKMEELLMTANEELLKEAEKTIEEIWRFFEKDLLKTGRILEDILLKLWEEFVASYPWIQKVEGMDLEGRFMGTKSFPQMKIKFLSYIESMLHLVEKYELHQKESIIHRTCTYILGHVEEELHLNQIAEEVHVSKDYLGKIFKQKIGYKFNDYVTKIKMEHGKYLLNTSSYKVYEVSEKLGYQNPDYFCRLFKEYTGYTPTQYRKIL
ncbi:response regulator transcription factor [Clostridium formicaceticum]|uniref:Stage 0 sporulation protein A homolog n=1 Tax=Clostridium formicaceticum TaxID=1497 RepID=A0AAC9WFI4_9CLOT|nr:response regulator [Clostridium formicaceticum]AOY76437.1 DNA-binding response regulator [Clostridium formicaceticum]ARE86833.1 putative response regulatory protein [Clostridium formicaceticum]